MSSGYKKGLMLLSGGLDSVVSMYIEHQRKAVHGALYFNYGQPSHRRELECAFKHCQKLGIGLEVLEVPKVKYYENTRLKDAREYPMRNVILLSYAANYAVGMGCAYVFSGMRSSFYPDSSSWFTNIFADIIWELTDSKVSAEAPVFSWSKTKIVEKAKALGINIEKDTWSCLNGITRCNECSSCKSLAKAVAGEKVD